MYCRNCGSNIDQNAMVCVKCGVQRNTGMSFCYNCGRKVEMQSSSCQSCGVSLAHSAGYTGGVGKSRILIGLLGIFFGTFGVHNFILGYTKKAVIQLLITMLTCGFGAFATFIWALIESIEILSGKVNEDADGVPFVD
jgi:TM2 domain-containing membrane protein YozV